MVAAMRITRDICRLLGLGRGPSEQRQEAMDTETASNQTDDTHSQDVLSGEEGLSEEERAKRRAERRRARRKRQRQRKKLEKVKKDANTGQEEDQHGGVESELEESDSETEELEEEERVQAMEETVEPKAPAAAVVSQNKTAPTPPLASGNKGNRQPAARSCEEEPEWDVSSAFVANAVSHIRPKAKSKTGRKSRENKENEARPREVTGPDAVTKISASLAEKGIELVKDGQYSQAVSMFTEAIGYDPKDYRFFGNRSYCYECLEQYQLALADAEQAIHLAPDWAKGYYRKGSALMGLQRYSEAEKAMEQVLKLDKKCEEAVNELFNCKVLQLMDHGYDEDQSVQLLEQYSTVQAVLAARGMNHESAQPGGPCPSLWVGNVTTELTEKHLWDLFKNYGEIESIRVLHERFCAFVNFKNAIMASRAMEKLNGIGIENTRLVVRYPDRRTQRTLPTPAVPQPAGAAGSRRRGPVNGDECYFWRTTGCHFGDKCRYKHIPEQRGKDRKPWQP
ncbi:hsp70-Hsp90 organizing protein isoform X2 [Chanos chanos]|uniref:Hsp70-Hsp90 organizing protein isoform X2 n=1 Tax=Chanos chanos TaxID=29144 RepID=A0A6J2V3W1_CHACN|nr:hsp70-Hsp90 organizing protein-like isoform X2 [Chanos chanos]